MNTELVGVAVDDIIDNLCCKGFGWHVVTVLEDKHYPPWTTVWGKCQNPACPNKCGCDDPHCGWNGVSSLDLSDLTEFYETGVRP